MDRSKMLAEAINKAIDEIDPTLNYDEFADAVAVVLTNEYGSHLSMSFVSKLLYYTEEVYGVQGND